MTSATARTRRSARTIWGVAGGVVLVAVGVTVSLAFGSRVVSIAEIGEGLRAFVSGDTAQEIGAIAVAERIPVPR